MGRRFGSSRAGQVMTRDHEVSIYADIGCIRRISHHNLARAVARPPYCIFGKVNDSVMVERG